MVSERFSNLLLGSYKDPLLTPCWQHCAGETGHAARGQVV